MPTNVDDIIRKLPAPQRKNIEARASKLITAEKKRQKGKRERRLKMMKNPPHIGGFLWRQLIEPAGLTVTGAAEVLGVSRPTLSTLINEKSALSGDMALRIEKAFGVSMETLMRMQNAYDIAQARKRDGKIRVKRYVTNTRRALASV